MMKLVKLSLRGDIANITVMNDNFLTTTVTLSLKSGGVSKIIYSNNSYELVTDGS